MSIPMPHWPSSDLAEQAIHKLAGRWIAEALGLDPDDGDISAALPIVYTLRWYLMTSDWRISAANISGGDKRISFYGNLASSENHASVSSQASTTELQ
jgi:hypothetical protein